MTLEVFRYIKGQDQCISYQEIKPGDYRTIVNKPLDILNQDQDEELIVLHCRKDDLVSVVYTIHPEVILSLLGHTQAFYTKEDVENRALLVRPGSEHFLHTRERLSGDIYVRFKYRISHR